MLLLSSPYSKRWAVRRCQQSPSHLLHTQRAGNDFTRAEITDSRMATFCPCGTLCWFFRYFIDCSGGVGAWDFGSAAIYINASSADVWIGYPGTQSVNYGRLIGPDVKTHLRMDPEIAEVESYLWVDGDWYTPNADGGSVSVYLSGISTRPEAMMFSRLLPVELREKLREPGAVIVDPADLATLGSHVGACLD